MADSQEVQPLQQSKDCQSVNNDMTEVMTPRRRNASSVTQPKWESDDSLGGTGLLKTVGGLTFDSSFDSANLKDCSYNSNSGEYDLYIAKDCDDTPHQTR